MKEQDPAAGVNNNQSSPPNNSLPDFEQFQAKVTTEQKATPLPQAQTDAEKSQSQAPAQPPVYNSDAFQQYYKLSQNFSQLSMKYYDKSQQQQPQPNYTQQVENNQSLSATQAPVNNINNSQQYYQQSFHYHQLSQQYYYKPYYQQQYNYAQQPNNPLYDQGFKANLAETLETNLNKGEEFRQSLNEQREAATKAQQEIAARNQTFTPPLNEPIVQPQPLAQEDIAKYDQNIDRVMGNLKNNELFIKETQWREAADRTENTIINSRPTVDASQLEDHGFETKYALAGYKHLIDAYTTLNSDKLKEEDTKSFAKANATLDTLIENDAKFSNIHNYDYEERNNFINNQHSNILQEIDSKGEAYSKGYAGHHAIIKYSKEEGQYYRTEYNAGFGTQKATDPAIGKLGYDFIDKQGKLHKDLQIEPVYGTNKQPILADQVGSVINYDLNNAVLKKTKEMDAASHKNT